jgi:hypothetical protein
MKVFARGLGQQVGVTALHQVVYLYPPITHKYRNDKETCADLIEGSMGGPELVSFEPSFCFGEVVKDLHFYVVTA